MATAELQQKLSQHYLSFHLETQCQYVSIEYLKLLSLAYNLNRCHVFSVAAQRGLWSPHSSGF